MSSRVRLTDWGLRDYGVTGQIGLEKTPEAFVETMVEVFREVRRVLRDDGTVWLNLGDSYAAQRGGTVMPAETLAGGVSGRGDGDAIRGRPSSGEQPRRNAAKIGLKHKDLCGIPWRVAFALQADGWYLRSEIIWHKPNPMPESVTDRPTKSHEQVFLLAKSERYFYDGEAVKEANVTEPHAAGYVSGSEYAIGPMSRGGHSQREGDQARIWGAGGGRNKRTVWTIPTQSYKGAHFATFPEKLVEPCILAGTSARGCCPKCGKQAERMVTSVRVPTRPGAATKIKVPSGWDTGKGGYGSYHRDGRGAPEYRDVLEVGNRDPQRHCSSTETTGWRMPCKCGRTDTVPAIVLDPFSGSGTTVRVARAHGRIGIGLELNPKYIELARERTVVTPPLFAEVC